MRKIRFLAMGVLARCLHHTCSCPDAFTPSDVKCLLHQLLSALAYMHERRFMHRDIKPANIYDGSGRSGKHGRLVICDFGMAGHYDSPARHTRCQLSRFTTALPSCFSGVKAMVLLWMRGRLAAVSASYFRVEFSCRARARSLSLRAYSAC